MEAKVTDWVPKARGPRGQGEGGRQDELADAITKRITKVQNRETKVNARLAKAEAACSADGTSAG